MPPSPILSLEELVRLPPRILGTIRWRRSVGSPMGAPCDGFDIVVEEHTATEYRDYGGGHYGPVPGTGIWKPVSSPVSCRALSDEDDRRVISFQVTGLHFNAPLDGYYRVTPRIVGNWASSGPLAFPSYRFIEPFSASVALKTDAPVQSVAFEVSRRSWFSGRRLA